MRYFILFSFGALSLGCQGDLVNKSKKPAVSLATESEKSCTLADTFPTVWDSLQGDSGPYKTIYGLKKPSTGSYQWGNNDAACCRSSECAENKGCVTDPQSYTNDNTAGLRAADASIGYCGATCAPDDFIFLLPPGESCSNNWCCKGMYCAEVADKVGGTRCWKCTEKGDVPDFSGCDDL